MTFPVMYVFRVMYVVAAALAVSACGTVHGDWPQSEPQSSARAFQAEISASHQRWAGTTDDHQAAAVLMAYGESGPFTDCMRDKGHLAYDWRGTIGLPAIQDSGMFGLLEPFDQNLARHTALAAAHSTAIDYRENNPETEYEGWNDKMDADASTCIDQTREEQISEAELDDLRRPPGLETVGADWYGSESVQAALLYGRDLPTTTTYARCMGEAGYGDGQVREADSLSVSVRERLWESAVKPPPRDHWQIVNDPAARDTDPTWNAFLASERAWQDADERCRLDLVETHIDSVRDLQRAFAAEHAEQISRLEEYWADIRARAAALGWSPEDPQAGWSPPNT